jgi:N-acetylmuramoyl-L-alanine amidase
MIYISSGHNSKSNTIRRDSGAVGNGYKEGDLTIEFKNLVCAELTRLGCKFVTDTEEESLSMYLKRIKTGNASVVIEYHFDASKNLQASGTTALVEGEADRLDKAFAKELVEATASCLAIKNRGVVTEAESHRGRLGLMREEGIICLMELAFISSSSDMWAYQKYKTTLAIIHARIIKKYEQMVL